MTDKKKPLFEQVADDIKRKVDEGVYGAAQKLPSEYDLANEYGVSRLTVRKAIQLLINLNILIKQSGKGTYIMKSAKNKKGFASLMGFSEAARYHGEEPSAKIISVGETEEVPEDISEALELKAGDTVIRVIRVRSLNQKPMTLEELYIHKKYLNDISEDKMKDSIFSQIEEKIEIAYSHQEVEAVLATGDIAKYLQVEEGAPSLKSFSVTYSVDAKPILYDITYHRADHYSFKKTVQRFRG